MNKKIALLVMSQCLVLMYSAGVSAQWLPFPPPPGGGSFGGQQRICGENQYCSLSRPTEVVYRAEPDYGTSSRPPVWMTGSFRCDNVTFLRDPAFGVPKSCFANLSSNPLPGLMAPGNLTPCAEENYQCHPSSVLQGFGPKLAYYGTGQDSTYAIKQVNGPFVCSNAFFGVDPAFGRVKRCYVKNAMPLPPPPPPPSSGQWRSCVGENQLCVIPFGINVMARYGAGDRFVYRPVTDNSFPCTNEFFGQDPYPNVVKHCEIQNLPFQ